MPDSDRIDFARFDGSRWSKPATLLRATRTMELEAGMPVRRRGADFFDDVVVTQASDSARYTYRGLAARRGTEWKTFDLRPKERGRQAGATRLDDGTYVVIEVASNDYPPPVQKPGTTRTVPQAMWASRGAWSGDSISWSPPVLIDTVAGGFTPPVWARLGKDSVFVLWRHEGDSLTPRGVRASISPDGGRTWRRITPFDNASAAMLGPLAVDDAGRLHFAYQIASMPGMLGSPGRVMHATFAGGRWSTSQAVSPRESMTAPGLGSIADGKVMLTWTEGQFYMGGVEPKSFMRIWSPEGCR